MTRQNRSSFTWLVRQQLRWLRTLFIPAIRRP